MLIIIDAGHGINTPGKRSPDYSFREYKYCRELALVFQEILRKAGFDTIYIMDEIEQDEPLSSRCQRINKIVGDRNDCVVISLHNNAAGMGLWMNARGWSAFVCPGASLNSKKLATLLTKSVESEGYKIRKPLPNLYYWEKNLYICKKTKCPAVLVENFFMDNKEDLAFLQSEDSKLIISNMLLKGILEYCKD